MVDWNTILNLVLLGFEFLFLVFMASFFWHIGKAVSDLVVTRSIFSHLKGVAEKEFKREEWDIDDPNDHNPKTKPKR